MNYSERVSEIRCHRALDNDRPDYLALVHYATLAASSHNTQPWVFKLETDRVWILPDLSRRCPAVDPDDHHLYASLGCAAENLLLAGEAAGLRGHYGFEPSASGVRIDFEASEPSRSPLFEAIPARQCSRVAYDGTPLTAAQLDELEAAGSGDGVSTMLLTDHDQKERVAQYVAEGNCAQFSDAAWARELKQWIRFSAREAVSAGDGLYGPVMGSPSVPRWLGLMAMRFSFSADKQNQADYRNILSSSALAVVSSEVDDRAHWVEAGRCYQRLALQATVMGLKTAFINQPVEVASLRPEFARFLGIGDRRPDLVLRIGYGPETPHSLRRPVEAVIA